MKPVLTHAAPLFLIVILVGLTASCGVPTRPNESTPVPTRIVTALPSIPSALPNTGGDPIPVDSEVDVSPPQVSTELPPAVVATVPPCGGPFGCARMGITQSGQVSQVEWSNQGVVSLQDKSFMPKEQSRDNHWVVDTGTTSPDGKWVAFTSLSYESGGPIFLQRLETGDWTNLIQTVNLMLPADRQRLPEDFLWDVIGWFPDSQRLLIGPYDMSFVAVVELSSFSARVIPFPGGGKGGRAHVTLSPEGSLFFYVGENASGAQTLSAYNLTSGDTTVLRVLPYEQGVLSFPRLSPDSKSLAYLRQQFSNASGFSGALEILSLETGTITSLVQGNLTKAVPAWAPDGGSLAFTLAEFDNTSLAAKDIARSGVRGNVWVVSLAEGAQKQITYVDGLARNPAWSPDGKTLAFITYDGQVGLASLDRPGEVWQAAGPAPDRPELTSVYFVP